MPYKIDNRHKIIKGRHRASSRYAMIKYRITHTETSKNSCYKGVLLLVSREDFIAWFMERDFEGASVDRIDSSGNYELSNMRLIPLEENIAKEKLIAKNGFTRCYKCHETKPLDQFVKDRRRKMVGVTTICVECERERGRARYYAKKNRLLRERREETSHGR